jgi:hypothetical protein
MPDLAGIDLALTALREYPAGRMLIISGCALGGERGGGASLAG